MLVVL
jgi:hypothetical protein